MSVLSGKDHGIWVVGLAALSFVGRGWELEAAVGTGGLTSSIRVLKITPLI